MSEDDASTGTLSEKFDKALGIHLDIQNWSESTNSVTFQKKIQNAVSLLENATHMVNELTLFSSNEDFEEIPTVHLKYLLLPALLGHLTAKLPSSERLQLVETAEIYFKDFLSRLNDYGVTDVTLPKTEEESVEENATGETVVPSQDDQMASLEAMALKRRTKIDRYIKQKKLEQTQKMLKARMEDGRTDDETVREYYSILLRSWVNTALEELESISLEKPILKHMAQLKKEGKEFKKDTPKMKPIKPVIIARNELQKKVIGVGYPSIPVLTVDEFYEHRYGGQNRENTLHQGLSLQKMAEDPEQTAREIEDEDAEKEEKLDKDDPVTLIRERNWDDWKDDHRRGWGNRHNMG